MSPAIEAIRSLAPDFAAARDRRRKTRAASGLPSRRAPCAGELDLRWVHCPSLPNRLEPPPPESGLQPPVCWCEAGCLDSLFGPVAGSAIRRRRTGVFRFRSAEEHLAFLRDSYGPTRRAFESLDPPRRESLRNDSLAVAHRYDRNGGLGSIAITADSLGTVIVRK